MALWLILGCVLAGEPTSAAPDARALARQIDRHLTERYQAEQIVPAERADEAEFLRRLHLDLTGRIPSPAEVRTFLSDTAADKRAHEIDRLLGDARHIQHFARVWRGLLLPEAETEPQIRYFQPGFEAWLEQRRTENAGFDKIVRELLTVPIARPDETPQFVLREIRQPNPLAFIASKGAEPEKVASSAVRLFLGVRLECAQCHDHPFDHWSREQFWNQAAFFAGIERRGRGPFALLVEDAERHSIAVMDSKATAEAVFLDESLPKIAERQSARGAFADWMTAPQNPFFARAIVNRVWAQLMGSGLVEPVDDFRESNPPVHPQLLEELARAFSESGFDMTFLQRAICLSDAYQRTSRRSSPEQSPPALFSRMALKPLSTEQLYDSFAQAVGRDAGRESGRQGPPRRRALAGFDLDQESGEPETSVAQSLALMNGSEIQRAATVETSARLKQVREAHPNSIAGQLDELYLATYGRFPTAAERDSLCEYYQRGDDSTRERRLGDIFWMLLNSPEFRWNH